VSVDNQDRATELLIQEVDEDLRREHYLKLWRIYGKYAIAAVIAIVLGVAGHQAWLNWRERQFQTEAASFEAAQDLLAAGKRAEAIGKLAEIQGAARGGFAMAAGFQRAELQLEAGDEAAAIASYDALSKGSFPQAFRDLAVLKSSLLTLEKDDPEMLRKRLQPLAEPGNGWRFTATELLALLAERQGDKSLAVSYFKKLADDPETPQTIRARAAEMLAVEGATPQQGKPEKG